MIFWTFVRLDIYSKVLTTGEYIPDFSKYIISEDMTDKLPAYNYILDVYNKRYIKKNVPHKGLIFGHIGTEITGNINTIDDLYTILDTMGYPSGTDYPNDTHVLLQLEIPDYIDVMIIDFYRFSDLIFFTSERYPYDYIQIYKDCLFTPNSSSWELLQGHIPYIKKEWILAKYTPRNSNNEVFTL